MFPVLNLATSISKLVFRNPTGWLPWCGVSAWAHMELTMLLKNVSVPSFDCYLAVSGRISFIIRIVPRSFCGFSHYQRKSMGPYGAHHAPEIIQFSCLSCTSSCVSGSKVSVGVRVLRSGTRSQFSNLAGNLTVQSWRLNLKQAKQNGPHWYSIGPNYWSYCKRVFSHC
jgi:hypothetical protein